MKITDKEVLKQLNIVKCSELRENIETTPDDEIDGRTDMQLLKDELEYLLSLYEDDGKCHYEDLEQAKHFMKETKRGKVIPFYNTFPPTTKYTPVRLSIMLEQAKNTINEYNRLVSLAKRLNMR